MPTAQSRLTWRDLERSDEGRQKRFLADWKDDFTTERVLSSKYNVARGDHLVKKGPSVDFHLYDHHMICTDVWYSARRQRYLIEVIHYNGPSKNPFGYVRPAFLDFTGLGEVRRETFTYKELEKTEAVKVIWPEELERFDVEEVIRRAESREGESWYDVLKNNCEHFVTWCKCGLKASLQVQDWYNWARDTFYAACAGVSEYVTSTKIAPLVVAGAANVSDELAGFFMEAGSASTFIIGGLLELGLAGYKTIQAVNQYNEGVITSEAQLARTVAKDWAKGGCRLGGGYVGSVVGLAFGPVGSVVGGVIGAGIGHLVVSFFDWLFS